MAVVLWVLMLVILILDVAATIDVVRRPDLRGGSKAIWIGLVFILPVIGLIVYVIARPSVVDMGDDPEKAKKAAAVAAAERAREQANQQGLGDYR
jgi:uncharacterized membrane protein YcfT